MTHRKDLRRSAEACGRERAKVERPYSPPRLEALGNVRDVTLGGSAGILDGGASFIEQPLFQ